MNKTLLVVALLAAPLAAAAQEKSGREVVESTCAACHATGKYGAPKIGDRQAWSARAARGLTSLTHSALTGIRNMPAHGGNPGLSDLEIARAITYMVNQSGGHWIEPASAADLAAERTGKQVVELQCVKCHGQGVDGAPKIGDLAAWTPRLTFGVDRLVREAINGHGGMPPRGNRADLTDDEIRRAILYMINPKGDTASAEAPVPPPARQADHVLVQGLDVYLGLVPAESLRRYPKGSPERTMHGGVPKGSGFYHLNVSILNDRTQAPVTGAKVEARLQQPGMAAVSKRLEPIDLAGVPSYGNYVWLQHGARYEITVSITRPGARRAVLARFEQAAY